MTDRYKAYSEYKDSGIEWLKYMPAHWQLIPAKHLFKRVQRPVRSEDGIVTAFRDGEVTLRSKRRVDGFTNATKEIGYQGVRKGDLLVHAMDGFAGAIGMSDSDGKCSPVCSVCVPWLPGVVDTKYYGYLVRQLAVTDFITSLAKGIRERSTEFRFGEFSALPLAVPPYIEQQKIANFLDHETAKIDTLITKQEKLIELLREKRQAEISHAVTKGLNPDAPMRDSGVEWLGKVPEHWSVKPAYITFEPTVKKNSDGKETNVLSLSYGRIVKRSVDTNFGLLPESFNTYQIINIGDLVLRLTDLQNDKKSLRVGLAKQNGIITSAYLKLKCKPMIDSYFAYYLLHSYDTTKVFYGMGGGLRQSMKFEELRRLPILLPEMKEQHNIVKFLTQKIGKFDSLIEASIQKIELMKERKIALISAVVTGKIDVRDWQGEA